MNKNIIGIDIGGTTVKIGMITNNGEIIDKWEIPTNTTNSGKSIIGDVWTSIERKLAVTNMKKTTILGIGIGAPGFIDGESGFVYEAVNIGWKEYNLAVELTGRSNLPVFLENDANIAALGENWKGAGNQARNLFAITLGTGVGGGIIANGEILNGDNGMAGEIGHITLDPNGLPCNCGRRGCLETVASATGIVRQAMDAIEHGASNSLLNHYRDNGRVSAEDIFKLAGNGDSTCKKIIKNTANALGLIIANMGTIINPSKVLIGGGVSKAGEQLRLEIEHAFQDYALPRVKSICEIKIAKLGNDAGIIGGAYLVKQKTQDVKF
ncbi:ROK family glucokinase [Virgibacillus sp. C22-A2]|uniref:Glucokinase n=1 Tax=Virgibacillus tibetensis TaxID=3042313 RepID=A0ABU6KAP3_9BACI|nr:ROK family glucokinase [Virgibacillus sp. C22-A2]